MAIIGGLIAWPGVALIIILAIFPLGAIAGAVFWLCAVWRSEGWDETAASFSDV